MADETRAKDPLVDWTRVLGGALAAVSSAFLLSTLGAVGTLAGAALGSVAISIFSSVYAHGLNRSRQRMAQAQEAAMRRVGIAQGEVHRARRRSAAGATDAHLQRADDNLAEARETLEAPPRRPSLGDRLAQLSWKRVALVAALTFAVAVSAITALELVAGRSLASFTGGTHSHHGTSFSNLGGGHSSPPPPPSPSSRPSPSPTSGTASSSPSAGPSSTPSSSPPSTPTPTPSPSQSPTGPPATSSTGPTPAG